MTTKERTVALVVHPDRALAVSAAERARIWLEGRGHVVLSCFTAKTVDAPQGLRGDLAGQAESSWQAPEWDCFGHRPDLVVSLGGDGTMIRAVELATPLGVPVLGVNLGVLGYLTEVEPGELEHALERFMAGDHGIEERMTLEVELLRADRAAGSEAGSCQPVLALNEAVLEKTAPGHTIRLAVSISGRPFLTYVADGMLVATPTGSTAYNLSVRGPIVSPSHRALVLTPVAPHMLFDRPLVLGPSEWLELEVLEGPPAALAVDGQQKAVVMPGSKVTCRAGPHPARFVTFAPRDFHSILKAKFNLADRLER
ncbi:MAG: NAD(+)/NADH kinase [Actinobacteria bacterium]|nr:NAD(+)/NADH kinase [Actinomycetota bacterium]